MHSRKLIDLIKNGREITDNEIDETIHVKSDEAEDDIKTYIRHNTGESIKEFYEQ